MRKTYRLIAVLAAFLLLSGCAEPAVPALAPSVQAEYDTAVVLRGDVERMQAFGAGISLEFIAAEANASGVVQEVLVQLGDMVSEGDLIARVDTDRLQSRLDALQAQYDALEANYTKQIAAAESQKQITELKKSQSGADTQLLAIEEEKLAARLQYLTGSRDAQLDQLARAIAQAEEAVQASFIYAPCDGTVAAVDAKAGKFMQLGAALAYIARTGSEYLLCTEGNAALARTTGECRMQLGDHFYPVELIEYTQEEFMAALLANNVPARFRLPEDLEVSAGTSAQLQVVDRRGEDVLYLPKGAVYDRAGRNAGYVYRIVDGEKVYTEVTYVFQTESWVVIEEGLKEGEVVYVPQSS